jgi:hypothetical protein
MLPRARRTLPAALLVLAACGPLFITPKPLSETRRVPSGQQFKTIATIATSSSQTGIGVAVHVRQRLIKAGINAVPAAGRWNSDQEAREAVCAKPDAAPNGVLLVSSADIQLFACGDKEPAYTVRGAAAEGGPGIDAMTKALVQYLHGEPPPKK